MACNNCTPTIPDCTDCTPILQTIDYCDDGCPDTYKTDCILYYGPTITLPSGATISNLESLTSIIKKLSSNSLDITVGATFDATSRILTLTKGSVTYASLTIPDNDNQFLAIEGDMLQIWKPVTGGSPIKINEVDITPLLQETPFVATSDSLVISNDGVNGHQPKIELVPSTDVGNHLSIGSDGKPFVGVQAQGIGDVHIQTVPGISYTKTVSGGVITFTPVIDIQWFADQICPLCTQSCGTVSNLIVEKA